MTRRQFAARAAAGLASAALQPVRLLEASSARPASRLCVFEKPLQFLSYSDLADFMVMLGCKGIEATVRSGGHVLPRNVEDDLPRLDEALKKRGLEITILATDINAADQPRAELVLQTAAKLGIHRYRMQWYKYDLRKPILPQLDIIAAKLPPLVALTQELGMSAIYQNHSGSDLVGAPLWDIYRLIQKFSPRAIGIGFDVHHAMIEGGLSWPIQFKLIQSHLAALYVKDFVWQNGKVKDVPLGQGQVDKKVFTLLRETTFNGPVCLHVEYMEGNRDQDALMDAFRKDLGTLRSLL